MTLRSKAIESMQALAARGINCSKCSGACCTFRFNSMQINAEEAQLIAAHLKENNLVSEYRPRLEKCITEFRLKNDLPSFGGRKSLVRTYTCPFYSGHALGCTLPTKVKPVGCLNFNPTVPNANDSLNSCRSNSNLITGHSNSSGMGMLESIPVAVRMALDFGPESAT